MDKLNESVYVCLEGFHNIKHIRCKLLHADFMLNMC